MNLKTFWTLAAVTLTICSAAQAHAEPADAAALADEAFLLEESGAWAEATSTYDAACAQGSLLACHNLGFAYARGRGVRRDRAEAERLYQRACDGGLVEGCHNLAVLYEEAKGEVEVAVQLYRVGCQGGVQESCAGQARLTAAQ